MKKLFLALSLLASTLAFAQDVKIQHTQKAVGTLKTKKQDIMGTVYTFPESIYNYYRDTTRNVVSVQLRGNDGKYYKNKGSLLNYSLSENQLLWNVPMNYSNYVYQTNDLLFLKQSYSLTALASKTGASSWSCGAYLIYASSKLKIGAGFEVPKWTTYPKVLKGIDLTNGKEIWKREVSTEYDLNEVIMFDDSTMFVLAGGVHAIKLKDGSGWDYNTVTGDKEYGATIAKNVAGAALGALTGVGFFSSGFNLVKNINSNLIYDSAHYYFASKEKLVSLDLHGKVVWSKEFPKNMASKSIIFKKDSSIYMINYGSATRDKTELKYNFPFIAAFDCKDGKQKYLYFVGDDPILTFEIKKDSLITVQKNIVALYKLSDGSNLQKKTVALDKDDELQDRVDDKMTYVNIGDSAFESFTSPRHLLTVYSKKGNFLDINDQLEVSKTAQYQTLYFKTSSYKGYNMIRSNNYSLFIVNKDFKTLGEINISPTYQIQSGKLLYCIGKDLMTVDLDALHAQLNP